MGQTGSYTYKASISISLRVLTTWGYNQLKSIILRSDQDLSETFALKKQEFHFLLGKECIDYYLAKELFDHVFDVGGKKIVDKLEVIAAMFLLSFLSTSSKVKFLFDIFDFNKKGFLIESEISLLIRTVTDAASKIDTSLVRPSDDAINMLVRQALLFSEVVEGQVRKLDFVRFAAYTSEVRAFLETWRGHSCQVLMEPNEKWIDVSFPVDYSSIAPSKAWLKLGFPPPSFIEWRRRSEIVSTSGELFGHIDRPLKTVDRRVIYEGPGALAEGIICQGLLADRWLLNAIAAVTANPAIIRSLFVTTGQENQSRFCVQLFEGMSWRNIYLDDYIPVGPDEAPLFAHTSYTREFWMPLLSKSIAKYLGSYGHLGKSAERVDAMDMALRWFTGGHVMRRPIAAYSWVQDETELEEVEGGFSFLQKILKEGSLVALGCSEIMPLTNRYSKQIHSKRNKNTATSTTTANSFNIAAAPPHGRVFPVVEAVTDKLSGNHSIVLRDPWGVIIPVGHPASGPDTASGHCRTFTIAVEDVPLCFDMMLLSRLPDTLREGAANAGINPWKTEIQSCISGGLNHPAKFLLTVSGNLPPLKKPAALKPIYSRASASNSVSNIVPVSPSKMDTRGRAEMNTQTTVPAVVNSTDPVEVLITISSGVDWSEVGGAGPQTRLFVVPIPETKDIYRKNYAKSKSDDDKEQKEEEEKRLEEERQKKKKLIKRKISTDPTPRMSIVQIASTTEDVAPLAVGVAPAPVSPDALSNIAIQAFDGNSTVNADAKPAETSPDEVAPMSAITSQNDASTLTADMAPPPAVASPSVADILVVDSSTQEHVSGNADETKDISPLTEDQVSINTIPVAVANRTAAAEKARRQARLKDHLAIAKNREISSGEFQSSSVSSWLSTSMTLLPGTYVILADVHFSDDVKMKQKSQRQMEEYGISADFDVDSNAVFAQVSSNGLFTLKALLSPEEIQKRAKKNFQLGSKANAVNKTFSRRIVSRRGKTNSPPKRTPSSPNRTMHTSDVKTHTSTGLSPTIGSSLASFYNRSKSSLSLMSSGSRSNIYEEPPEVSLTFLHNISLKKSVLVDEEKWPFTVESQLETSSKCLVDMISKLRIEANVVQADLISLQSRYTNDRNEADILS